MSSFALVDSFFEKDVLCDSDKQLGPSRQGRISRYTRTQYLEEAAKKDFFISKQFDGAGRNQESRGEASMKLKKPQKEAYSSLQIAIISHTGR